MSDFFWQVITSSAVSALLVAALVFLSKSWISERLKNAIKHEYDQKLEAHKAKLKSEADVSVEQLKSRLNLVAVEHSVQFSRLDSRRAETIAKMYTLLVRFHRRTHIFVSVSGWSPNEKREDLAAAKSSLVELMRYYDEHRIYLPASLCQQIDDLIKDMSRRASEFSLFVEVGEEALSPDARVAMDKKWNEVSSYFDNEIPSMRKKLEDELRRVLEPPTTAGN